MDAKCLIYPQLPTPVCWERKRVSATATVLDDEQLTSSSKVYRAARASSVMEKTSLTEPVSNVAIIRGRGRETNSDLGGTSNFLKLRGTV